LTERPLNARLETGVGLSFFLSFPSAAPGLRGAELVAASRLRDEAGDLRRQVEVRPRKERKKDLRPLPGVC
jgi:hypothetical protein